MRLILILSIVISFLLPPTVRAVTVPAFPSCANPGGEIQVSYSSGTHGIVGSSAVYTGSDTVYRLSDDAVTQCFCAENGEGIQTDWWKVRSQTQSELDVLVSQGWIYIPAGEKWGLDTGPYLARNTTLSCLPGSSPAAAISNDGQVLGDAVGGEILGLASTGNTAFVWAVFLSGLTLLIIGFRRLRQL